MDENKEIKNTVNVDDAKTVVIDRSELTELMTVSREHKAITSADLELEQILLEAHGYDVSLPVPERIQTPVPAPPPIQTAPRVKPEPGEAAQRIIEENAESEQHKKKKRIIIICAAAVCVLAVALAVIIVMQNSGKKRQYNEAFNAAQLMYYDGKYDEALNSLRSAMGVDKTDECLLLMSQCYEAKLDYVNAISILESSNTENEIIQKRIKKLKAAQEEYESGKVAVICGEQFDVNATVVDLSDRDISGAGLSELSKLKELTSLKLADNRISDPEFLAPLTKLVSLDLSDNEIEDISVIAQLTGLRTLHLDGNEGIKDLSPLYGLRNLTMLTISGIDITEKQLNELKTRLPGCLIYSDEASIDVVEIQIGGKTVKSDATSLDLSGCEIVDVSPLSVCTQLKELDLSGNYISDLSALIDIPGLVVLDLSDNRISDIRPLMGMTTLEHLNLAGNRISSVTSLTRLTSLKELVLNNNKLVGIQSLQNLTELQVLGLKSAELIDDDLLNLYQLKSLRKLSVNDNPELTESGVAALQEKLPKCSISHSELRKEIELGGKRFAPDAETVDASGLGIGDISAAADFTQIKELDLSGNIITSVEPLADLATLEVLDLTDNNIEDVSPLFALSGLKQLLLSNNNLSDEQIAAIVEALPNCAITVE